MSDRVECPPEYEPTRDGLSRGFDFGAPAAECAPPFPFTGTIREVAVDLAGELIQDNEAEMRLLMARQ